MTFFKNILLALIFATLFVCSMSAQASLEPGDKAPDFSAPAWLAGDAFEFRLADALATGPVVLYFFPAANTPGCNLEAALFSQSIDRFEELGATVIGVTAGNTDQLQEFSADGATCAGKFAVAADEGARIAADYDATLEDRELSSRTSYVIGSDGRIEAVHSDLNPSHHVEAMLESLTAGD